MTASTKDGAAADAFLAKLKGLAGNFQPPPNVSATDATARDARIQKILAKAELGRGRPASTKFTSTRVNTDRRRDSLNRSSTSRKASPNMGDVSEKKKIGPAGLILLVLAGIVLNQAFWAWSDIRKEAYNNTTAGLLELAIEKGKKVDVPLAEARAQELKASARPSGISAPPQEFPREVKTNTTGAIQVFDGERSYLPEGRMVTLVGPMEATLIIKYQVKSLSGVFKVSDISGNMGEAWTDGWSNGGSSSRVLDILNTTQDPTGVRRVKISVRGGSTVTFQT